MDKVKILLILLLLTTSCFAEEPADMLKNFSINIDASPKKEYLENISEQDKRIARAIANASAYAFIMGDDNYQFEYKYVELIVKKCRYFYNKDKPGVTFIQFVKQDLDRHFTNCDNWVLYVAAFLEE